MCAVLEERQDWRGTTCPDYGGFAPIHGGYASWRFHTQARRFCILVDSKTTKIFKAPPKPKDIHKHKTQTYKIKKTYEEVKNPITPKRNKYAHKARTHAHGRHYLYEFPSFLWLTLKAPIPTGDLNLGTKIDFVGILLC